VSTAQQHYSSIALLHKISSTALASKHITLASPTMASLAVESVLHVLDLHGSDIRIPLDRILFLRVPGGTTSETVQMYTVLLIMT